MEAKLKFSYVAIALLLLFIILMLTGVFNRDKPSDYRDELISIFQKKQKIFAGIGITTDRKLVFVGIENSPDKADSGFEKCSFRKKSKLPRCRGADNILGFDTITLVFTKGSTCVSDPNRNGDAVQYCYP
jgi:hypothetical protein